MFKDFSNKTFLVFTEQTGCWRMFKIGHILLNEFYRRNDKTKKDESKKK